ncbi:unc-13 homolog D-like protein, putative [Babesia caballi]|uniref:Unc-13 homolog D-like protein, putative n=1 Tax=Babesia caballi TaxID=5871 RepID=A0AAV4LQB7_BABCB|nr:unc-13 homolog D-like protein, putative [Babesia caballi]
MRTTRSEKWRRARGPYERLFFEALGRITMADVLGRLNAQATVNCVFAVTLTGLGHRMPLFLYRLLVKLRRGWPSGVGCVEMDKQVKTVVLILERSGSRYNRGIRNEVKRLGKMWRERTGEVASVERLEGRVIGTRQPMLSGESAQGGVAARGEGERRRRGTVGGAEREGGVLHGLGSETRRRGDAHRGGRAHTLLPRYTRGSADVAAEARRAKGAGQASRARAVLRLAAGAGTSQVKPQGGPEVGPR